MRDPYCGIGRVHALSAGAGRAVDVHLEVVRIDLDLHLLSLRHHGDGCGRRVDPPLRLGLRYPLHAVCAAFPREEAVRLVAFDGERDLLEAAAIARARAELLDAQTSALGVPRQHPVEVGGPERGLVAADALPN